MTTTELHLIAGTFGKMNGMDPDGPVYRRLCAILDNANDEALVILRAAKIKFVSSLAANRAARRGL